jgi:hypothetical protein
VLYATQEWSDELGYRLDDIQGSDISALLFGPQTAEADIIKLQKAMGSADTTSLSIMVYTKVTFFKMKVVM